MSTSPSFCSAPARPGPTSYTPVPEFETREPPRLSRHPKNIILSCDFDPPESVASLILQDLARNDISLCDVAVAAETTPEALSLWMSRPAIAERLAAILGAMIFRVRLQCAHSAGNIVAACNQVVREYTKDSIDYDSGSTPVARAIACRNRETAIDAGKLFCRLATIYNAAEPITRQPSPAPAAPPAQASESSDSPSLREGAGGRASAAPLPTACNPTAPSSDSQSHPPAPTVPQSRPDSETLHTLRSRRFPESPPSSSLSEPAKESPSAPPLLRTVQHLPHARDEQGSASGSRG